MTGSESTLAHNDEGEVLPFAVTLGGMWTPASVDELERAARSGRLVEKKRFEAKREVGRNKDVAIDVNAMWAGELAVRAAVD